VKIVFGELQRLSRSPDAQIIGVLEDLRREPDQRASPFDAFRSHLSGDLVEALDHPFLVAGLEAGVEEIADGSHNRVVSIDQLTQG
jgi:hypothetical protein